MAAGCRPRHFALLVWMLSVTAPVALAGDVEFSRDVRPILADRCFVCHGPDAGTREADLRLDSFEEATRDRGGWRAIAPGDPAQSELMQRVASEDPDYVMPPEGSHRTKLDQEERAILETWIEQGARYAEHWSFVSPQRPELPDAGLHPVDAFVRARLAAEGLEPSPPVEPELGLRRLFLDLTGLPPTPEETAAYLAELEAGADPESLWARWIGRLFTEEPYRSRYAERMASPWLDQARYADTNGIHMDAGRQIWPWRDWVLEAYRSNMPFDRFVLAQVAGDLLPDATQAQIVASGFHRNHVMTDEGGAIDAEYLVEYAADRVTTTGSVFLGLTLLCARCHDHKFDPVSQEDFYQLFSFFYSNEEPGLYSQIPDPNRAMEPFLEVPSAEQLERRESLAQEIELVREDLEQPSAADLEALEGFRGRVPGDLGLRWTESEVVEAISEGGATLTVTDAGSVLASGENPATDVHTFRLRTEGRGLHAVQLDVLRHESFVNGAPGRGMNGNAVLTSVEFEAVSVADPDIREPLEVSWAWADRFQDNDDYGILRALDERDNTGWAIGGHEHGDECSALFVFDREFGYEGGTELVVRLSYESIWSGHVFGHVHLSLASLSARGLDRLPLAQGAWYHAGPFSVGAGDAYEREFGPASATAFDPTVDIEADDGAYVRWSYKREFRDGEVTSLVGGVNLHYVGKELYSTTAREVEVSLGSDDGFELWLNGSRVAERNIARAVGADQDRASIELSPGRNSLVLKVVNTGGLAGFYFDALETSERLPVDMLPVVLYPGARTDHGASWEERVVHAWRLEGSPEYSEGLALISQLEQESAQLESEIPRTMVMRDRSEPRQAYVLDRGEYNKVDEERPVEPGIPGLFGQLETSTGDESTRATRLDLAQWLTAPENPLVARVAVNRLWQLLFGTGIVATSGDFGTQGEWPSHPELLDWLAVEFVESGWDVQQLMTTIVTSETYRQASAVRPEVFEVDPHARLLAAYPRRRLDAEAIRDQALYVSGLLREELGGPSVKPYQPEGLWREVAMLQSNTRIFERGGEEDLWRRSLYTYWKRACPPPSLLTFDAPTREACVVRRSQTNTPLQALVLWNDTQFLEAARVLAERTLRETQSEGEGLRRLFQRCTGREPSERELELMSGTLARYLERYADDEQGAAALLEIGDAPLDVELAPSRVAAWTLVASAVLNLHSSITQG
jgi:hypothetical protein